MSLSKNVMSLFKQMPLFEAIVHKDKKYKHSWKHKVKKVAHDSCFHRLMCELAIEQPHRRIRRDFTHMAHVHRYAILSKHLLYFCFWITLMLVNRGPVVIFKLI